MKKLTLSLVAAGLAASSLGAYAAVPTGAAPFQVVVPNLKSGVEFTLEGLYLQPSNSDLAYTSTASTNPDTRVTTVNEHFIRPKYNLGFRAAFGYVFPNSGNDVQVAWTRFHRNNTNGISINHGEGVGIENRVGDATFNYDAVDLDVGQYVSIGTRLQTRGFIGLRGARLESTKGFTNESPKGLSTWTSDRSRFTGVGPRVGIDSVYHIGNCFGVVAHFATALLVGDLEHDASVGNSVTDVTSLHNATKQRRTVPGFDAKLGVDYTIKFPNQASSMSIEAGYQATHYAGVVDRYRNLDVLAGAFGATTSSVGFNGPYLSLNFKI